MTRGTWVNAQRFLLVFIESIRSLFLGPCVNFVQAAAGTTLLRALTEHYL